MRFAIVLMLAVSLVLSVAAGAASAYDDKAEIISLAGEVSVLPSGKSEWIKAGVGMVLRRGDEIKTGSGSSCDIAFDKEGDNVVSVLMDSDVAILLDKNEKIELVNASIYAKVKSLPSGSTFEVRSPTAVCGARGTGFGVKGDQDSTEATAYQKGIFARNNSGEEKNIGEGFMRKVDKAGRISDLISVKLEKMQSFGNWSRSIGKVINSYKKSHSKKMDRFSGRAEKIIERTEQVVEKEDERNIEKREDRIDSSSGGQETGYHTKS